MDAGLAWKLWNTVAKRRPLIFNISNFVVMNEQAHVALAVGASPLMSQHPAEAADLATIADATVLNIGTPTTESIQSMERALDSANFAGRPILLDPVGYGATTLRTNLVLSLLDRGRVDLIKGNEGEIAGLGRAGGEVRGVDSGKAGNLREGLLRVAQEHRCVAVATGPVDRVSDGESVWEVHGGSPLLTRITGSGCWLGTVITALAASSHRALIVEATLVGLLAFKVASEKASATKTGVASFRTQFIDALGDMTSRDFILAADRVTRA